MTVREPQTYVVIQREIWKWRKLETSLKDVILTVFSSTSCWESNGLRIRCGSEITDSRNRCAVDGTKHGQRKKSSESIQMNNDTNFSSPFIADWLTWSLVTNPLFIILHLSSAVTNLILLITMLKDPLKCFRSVSSYLLFNLVVNGLVPMLSYCLYIVTVAGDTVYFGVWTLVFAFNNTILAVLFSSLDRYILVSRPIMYSVIVTKSRVICILVISWIICLVSAFGIAVRVKNIVSAIILFVFLPLILSMVFAIIVVDIKTWRSISKAQKELLRLGSESISDTESRNYRAEQKRIQTEKRFAKVVALLLLNVVMFIFPQMLVVSSRVINVWCNLCIKTLRQDKASVFQVYYFPLFYLTTPLLYLFFIPKYHKSLSELLSCFKVSRRWQVPK